MNNEFKIRKILIKAFGQGDLSRDRVNFAVACPACSASKTNKRKLVIRLDDCRYHCWVCGIKGKNISYLIKKYRPDLSDLVPGIKASKSSSAVQDSVVLPKDFIHLSSYRGLDPDILAVINYLKSRGISSRDISRWRLLSCKAGQFRRRVLVPSFDSIGDLNYYIARTIDVDVKPKYKNAKSKKKEIIFNEIDIDWEKPVILVEGIFDAIKSPENAIPILGSYMSRDSLLYNRIVANQSTVYLSLDPDMKGKAYKIASSLEKGGCKVYVSFADKGNDLGDMTKNNVRDLLVKSTPYSREIDLYHRISQIKSGSIV